MRRASAEVACLWTHQVELLIEKVGPLLGGRGWRQSQHALAWHVGGRVLDLALPLSSCDHAANRSVARDRSQAVGSADIRQEQPRMIDGHAAQVGDITRIVDAPPPRRQLETVPKGLLPSEEILLLVPFRQRQDADHIAAGL